MSQHTPPVYEFGPFLLDAGKRLLLRNGEQVPLASKVLDTLLVLIEHRDGVLSKDELLTQVWRDTIVEEGGLARNISVLRKALGETPQDHQYIVTVPARGYRFVADVRERRGKDVPVDGVDPLTSARRSIQAADGKGPLSSVNPAAYDSLLRARYLSVRTTDADTQAAIALLERAVALEPTFAVAYGDLAAAYVARLTFVTPDETGELEQKAFAAAEKALSLDPNVAEAYLARGDLLWTHAHRFAHERAAHEFRRAVELKPQSDQGHGRLARVYVHVGFFEDALRHAAIALTINPSNAQALNSRAQALLWMGRDEEALDILSSIPGPVLPELVEANTVFALFRLNRRDDAWLHLRRARRKYPNDPSGTLSGIEAMLLADSEPLDAQALIEKVAKKKAVNPSHHAAYFAASAWARMGRAQEAVQSLREAADTGFPCYPLFAHDPNLDRIRDNPHFQAWLADMQKRFDSLRKALFAGT
jgi:DNA-binding winged helix-turn-helix (wHTH) protein/Tfp pilus assembly protein PilF